MIVFTFLMCLTAVWMVVVVSMIIDNDLSYFGLVVNGLVFGFLMVFIFFKLNIL